MIKAAVIDLYNNEKNEGMRCIKEILSDSALLYDVFETRYKNDIPSEDYDIYISSGGPGSPFEGEGKEWEKKYFNLIESVWNFNQSANERKKYFFFICHSFQMMARFFRFGEVTKRKQESFGLFPFEKTTEGKNDFLLKELPDPFYGADFRKFQVINPDEKIIKDIGAEILAVEHETSENGHPALMAIRISDEIAGTQFHPEADPESMMYHFSQPERKKHIIEKYSEEKYVEMINILEQPDKIKLTRKTILPNFLNEAIKNLNKF
ncbi:MAG: GMP synthase [Ignavibacteriales bacterium]|nr:MAG: GMP synthase [Ignavibacteriales bacterium]